MGEPKYCNYPAFTTQRMPDHLMISIKLYVRLSIKLETLEQSEVK